MISVPFARTFGPVNFCIYCGAERHSLNRRRLGDEHIVPYCLDGELILPKASCGKCERKTCAVEEALFGRNGHYRAARVQAGSRSRDAKPKTVPIYVDGVVEDGKTPSGFRRIEMPADAGPRWVMLAEMKPPSVLEGSGHYDALYDVDLWLMDINPATANTAGGFTRPFSPPGMDLTKLLKFLAKVGHAYATAVFGHGAFTPLLTDFIRGKDPLNPWGLIGGAEPIERRRWGGLHQEPYLIDHRIERVEDIDYIVVDMRLLAKVPFPTYRVIPGILVDHLDRVTRGNGGR